MKSYKKGKGKREEGRGKKNKKAVILVGHGSLVKGFDASMIKIGRALAKEKRIGKVLCAYLEITKPSIAQAIGGAVAGGAREVRVLPYFLLTGKHVTRHIPQIVAAARRKHRGRVKIILCPYLGYHDKIVSVVEQRIRKA